jgi:membrane protein
VFVAVAFELAKKTLAWYVDSVPTYNAVYGAFAAVPIMLLWVYLGWVIMLLGAVIAAYAPSLQMRVAARPAVPGWRFELALAVLQRLADVRGTEQRGLTPAALSAALRADPLQIEPMLETLAQLDWVQQLDEGDTSRHVLLCDPARTALAPLLQRTLLEPGESSAAFVSRARWWDLNLADALVR